MLKGTSLVARPFAGTAPARTIALAARPTSPRLTDVELLAEAIVGQANPAGASPAPRRAQRAAKSA
ncbi:MAG: hypothetical protein ACOZDY_13690 [Pseudomonadota bacterium]